MILVKTFVMAKTTISTVYNINYHIVWYPKYRKRILRSKDSIYCKIKTL